PVFATPAVGLRRSSRRVLISVAGVLAALRALALIAYLALPTAFQRIRSHDGEAGEPSEARSSPPESQALGVAQDPLGLASAEMLARKKTRGARPRKGLASGELSSKVQ